MRAESTAQSSDVRCPGCGTDTGSSTRSCCPGCGISRTGPLAAELYWVTAELSRLGYAHGRLLVRHAFLLAELQRQRQRQSGPADASAPLDAATTGAPVAAGLGQLPSRTDSGPADPASVGQCLVSPSSAKAPEISRRTAANLLLGSGGLLVVIAAVAFTAANWGSIGTAGRALILLALVSLALAAPWPLARRGLTATAETFAGIGLALTVADTYEVRNLVTGGSAPGLGFVAASAAVLAGVWAAYGSFGPARGPWPAAIALSQLPIPLAVAAVTRAPGELALAVLVTAAGDLMLVSWAARRQLRAERYAGNAAAIVTWLSGLVLASIGAAAGPAEAQSLWLGVAFLLAAGIGLRLRLPTRLAEVTSAAQVAAGTLIAVGLALPAAAELAAGSAVGAFAVSGAMVAAAFQRWAQRPQRPREATRSAWPRLAGQSRYRVAGALAVLGTAGLLVASPALAALLAPLADLDRIWAGGPAVGRSGQRLAEMWNGSHITLIAPAVLLLLSLACWHAPESRRSMTRPAALAIAALAGGSIPVAAGLSGWAALMAATALAAVLLGAGAVWSDRLQAGAAYWAGIVLAASATASSLTTPRSTIAELAVLLGIFAATAWFAQSALPTVLALAGAVATAVGLACAVPLAIGSGSAAQAAAAFAVLGVAVAAIGTATLLRRVRPRHALTLDAAAWPVILLAVAITARRPEMFSVLTTAATALAAATAWLRAGQRRVVAVGVTAVAAVLAVAAQLPPLTAAIALPYRRLISQRHGLLPWHGLSSGHSLSLWRGSPSGHGSAGGLAGLPLAVILLSVCAASVIIATGAWRGQHRSLDAVAVVLPFVAAPAVVSTGLSYGWTVGLLLALTAGLTGWAAASRTMVPAGAALVASWLSLSWALATPAATVAALGVLSVVSALGAWRARLASVQVGAAAVATLAAGALAGTSVLAAGLPGWIAGLAMLAVAGGAQVSAATLIRAVPDSEVQAAATRTLISRGVEIAGWLVACTGVVLGLGDPWHAGFALLTGGILCLGVALRPDRRPLFWAGMTLAEVALCVWLAVAGVRVPEAYTVPAAVVVMAFGWHRRRCAPGTSSWLTYGPGLALLLLPSLVTAWPGHSWVRPLLLGLVAAGVTLAGGRSRLQAPLLLGAVVTIVDAGRQLAPEVARLAGLLPRWVPIALLGLVLLAAGATYEARLKELAKLRAALGRMR